MKTPKLAHRLLAWLPPALLLAGAANHFYLVRHHDLSPWLAGGFGMFATSDVGSSRLLVVTAATVDGDRRRVTLNAPLDELTKRVRGLPNREQSAALAAAILDDLGYDGSGVAQGELRSLTIEVWRTDFEPDTLRPRQALINSERFMLDD